MPKLCVGTLSGVPCSLGRNGNPSVLFQTSIRCGFCDTENLNDIILCPKRRAALVKKFRDMTEEQQNSVLPRIAEEYKPYFLKLAADRCLGRSDQPCIFAASHSNERAKTHGERPRCDFCDKRQLKHLCKTPQGRQQLVAKLRKMSPLTADIAIDQYIRDVNEDLAIELNAIGLEEYGRKVETGQAKEPAKRIRRASMDVTAYTKQEIQNRWLKSANEWHDINEHGHFGTTIKHTGEEQKRYRKQLLDDRNRTLHKMGFPAERVQAGSDVCNDSADITEPAHRTQLAAKIEHWCRYSSWGVCSHCGVLQPRAMIPSTFDRQVSPELPKYQCSFCNAKQSFADVPTVCSVPDELKNLTTATRAALSLLEIDMGPTVYARDGGGRIAGYRQHTSMMRFSWQRRSVRRRLDNLPSPEERTAGYKAWRWLRKQKPDDCTYNWYHQRHLEFLERNPQPLDRDRKLWLREIEQAGVECAIWPHLFWKVQMCLTYVREMAPTRIAKRHKETLEDVYNADVEAYEEYEDELQDSMSSTKRWYQALAMCAVYDYGAANDLLQFAWDLNLWTSIGSKRNVMGSDTNVPLKVMMKGNSFSPLYWRKAHLALVDLVRQRGPPNIYFTMSPYEWTMPYHAALRQRMADTNRAKMKMPVMETLHLTHVLLETCKGVLMGTNAQGGRNSKEWLFHLLGSEAPLAENTFGSSVSSSARIEGAATSVDSAADAETIDASSRIGDGPAEDNSRGPSGNEHPKKKQRIQANGSQQRQGSKSFSDILCERVPVENEPASSSKGFVESRRTEVTSPVHVTPRTSNEDAIVGSERYDYSSTARRGVVDVMGARSVADAPGELRRRAKSGAADIDVVEDAGMSSNVGEARGRRLRQKTTLS